MLREYFANLNEKTIIKKIGSFNKLSNLLAWIKLNSEKNIILVNNGKSTSKKVEVINTLNFLKNHQKFENSRILC